MTRIEEMRNIDDEKFKMIMEEFKTFQKNLHNA